MLKRISKFCKSLCLLGLLATIILPEARAAEPSKAYYELVGKADKAISDTKFEEAIEYLRDAIRMEPENPMNILLQSNIGMVQFYAGADTLAIETLSDAHRKAPASVTVLQNRAKVYTAMGRPLDALHDYSRIIALDSTLVEPVYYHSMISFSLGDDSTCVADIEKMKHLFPDNNATYLAEANFFTYSGHYHEAIPLLSKVIEANPTATDYSARALCYLMTDQLGEASEDIARGIELDPTDGELYLYRAMLNKARYRPDDARADAQKARMYGVASERIKSLGLD